jgi:dihydrolipoamide dehydrogenase
MVWSRTSSICSVYPPWTTRVIGAEEEGGEDEIAVTLERGNGGQEAAFDRVLVAVGRRPNTEDLGLEAAGVETDEARFIRVDDQRRTSVGKIFAIGDAAGGMQLAHEAMREGKVAAEVIAGRPASFDPRAIPAVVYTEPQIAWCGLTEEQAQRDGREVEVTRFPWRASGRALTMGSPEGLTKLILEAETGRILGMGAVGRGAEGVVSEGMLAIEMGALAEDLALGIHPHPTLSETLGEAAELLLGGATHILRGKKRNGNQRPPNVSYWTGRMSPGYRLLRRRLAVLHEGDPNLCTRCGGPSPTPATRPS